ncbi:putative 26S proteasome subunit yta6 [Dimargaris verticillata]|uniref:microtubule-severing ATPase n=1 Tax=Dimargaris verticillata TaxID=2761393 RepID=A0A9W8B3A1_9FUNG|nr:putative 26S proteasome subunit yta6 [Dimargaris verticillata]
MLRSAGWLTSKSLAFGALLDFQAFATPPVLWGLVLAIGVVLVTAYVWRARLLPTHSNAHSPAPLASTPPPWPTDRTADCTNLAGRTAALTPCPPNTPSPRPLQSPTMPLHQRCDSGVESDHSSPLDQFIHDHDLAYRCVEKGLALDQQRQAEAAFKHYTLGLKKIHTCLAIRLPPDQKNDPGIEKKCINLERARRTVEERIRYLAPRCPEITSRPRAATTAGSPTADASHPAWPLAPVRSEALRSPDSSPSPSRLLSFSSANTSVSSLPPLTASSSRNQSGILQRLQAQNIDTKMAHYILNEVLVHRPVVAWSDIAGLSQAKQLLQESAIYPLLRPDLFTGIRSPPKGILLFGPPGTGKTILAQATAHEARCTFFNISASSLISRYVGDSEKLVRTLFTLARELAPAVIFVDEVDSILTERSATEHDASRRLKTEFLLHFDGVLSSNQDSEGYVMVMGATNRPEELDDAIRRRFTRRILISLPDAPARRQLIQTLCQMDAANGNAASASHQGAQTQLTTMELNSLVELTQFYSGSDIHTVGKEAALAPIREIVSRDQLFVTPANSVRPVSYTDWCQALARIKPSVNLPRLTTYDLWNQRYGMNHEP